MDYPVANFLGFLTIFHFISCILVYIVQRIRVLINTASPPNYVEKYGKWAVVTGCTDGIGLAYARELASRGFSLVLISRSKDKLQTVASDLEREFKVESKIIQVDFSSESHQIYEKIKNELQNLDIGVLVNNVGVGAPTMMPIENLTESQIWDHVIVNTLSLTMMTKLVLPAMKDRKRGAIINLSSTAALAPTPYGAVYSSTKTYVLNLTRSLQYECRNSGVTIQLLYPGFIKTSMLFYKPVLVSYSEMWVPTAETFVKHAILTLGVVESTTGFYGHEHNACFAQFTPWLWKITSAIFYKTVHAEYEKKVSQQKIE